MAYLGNAPARSFISFERQVFTIVNSQTAYTLDHSVNNENDIRLVINNIVQEPGSGKAYTASGTTLTLSAALVNGTDEMYCVFLGRAVATNAPGAGSVGASQLASDAVTAAKLNDDIISGQTELASAPADTDEFLVSDAGTIKRIDYSLIKAGGLQSVQVFTSSGTYTKPTGINRIRVFITGGGGAGGNGDSGVTYSAAGGGAAGGTAIELLDASSITTVTVTIGAGAVNGGAASGTSSFGSFCSATGGTNGKNTNGAGGTNIGGNGVGGDLNLYGQGGGGSFAPTTQTQGIAGGNSYWGGGAGGVYSQNGVDGYHGGGGSGGNVVGSSGGDGGDGICYVEEYI